MHKITFVILLFAATGLSAQRNYWQQKVHYTIDVTMNVTTNRFSGKEKLIYSNNSPDTLKKIFYHLYWNAFQPNSMLDIRNRELMKDSTSIKGWTDIQKDRIQHLKPEETGYQHIASVKMNGVDQKYQVDETILEVFLNKPVVPHSTVTLEINFEAQVPLQVRRSGRDNPKTGVRYSMSQWYPKVCEYDEAGWHPTPYVGREFYGVWGDFDVTINIDKNYILGGTGYLRNAAAIGYGYEQPGTKVSVQPGKKNLWHFTAKNVHDFMWAADTGYRHLVRHITNGPTLHVLYVNHHNDLSLDTSWNELADAVATVFPFMQSNFGKYAYQQLSVIQGGDGGMEYPMSCLVEDANIGSAFHEILHNWYYGMLGTNESLYAWMDEGFTCYAYDLVWDHYLDSYVKAHPENTRAKQMADYFKTLLPAYHFENYNSYFDLVKSGIEEPLSTHADHFNTRAGYEIGVYAKGDVFVGQLEYIVGADVLKKILLEYYKQWRFKHPNPNDFFRIAEKISQLQLDWYREYWINSTKTIDYAVDSIWADSGKTKIQLSMKGKMPMPIDLTIHYKDNSTKIAYIPQYLMFGSKSWKENSTKVTVYEPWKWTNPTYILTVDTDISQLSAVEIDVSRRMADVNPENGKKVVAVK